MSAIRKTQPGREPGATDLLASELPQLTVLIPCRNEARFLSRCLDSVLASDYPHELMEVLVIDGESTDGSRAVVERYAATDARVRLIGNPERVTPCALNRGIDEASGKVIARIDAHATVSPAYLSECVRHLLRSGADQVGGAMRTVARDPGFWAPAIVAALGHRFGVGNSHFRTGTSEPKWVDTVFAGCWRREVFDRLGRFHPQLARSQDMEFNLRLKALGGRTLLVPSVSSTYYARSRLREFCRHNFVNGVWAILPFVYSDIVPVSMRHLVPCAFALALGLALAALPWTAWLLVAVGVPYVLANLAASLSYAAVAWRTGLAPPSQHPRSGISGDCTRYRTMHRALKLAVCLPVVFAALHLSYGLGSAWGVVVAAGVVRGREWNRSEDNSCKQLQPY